MSATNDQTRGSSAQRGYGGRWQRLRKTFLSQPENALCRMCGMEGRITAADTVDHIVPHRGDPALLWDETNLQPLCRFHHSGAKQRAEKTGKVIGTDAAGVPLDPSHPWQRRA